MNIDLLFIKSGRHNCTIRRVAVDTSIRTMSIEVTPANEPFSLDVTLTQSNFGLMELISEYCESISRVVITKNTGMSLDELKSIANEIVNMEGIQDKRELQPSKMENIDKQQLGYHQIKGERLCYKHVIASNTRQYTMVFGKAYKAQLQKIRKKYDVEINIYAGNIEVRSGAPTLSAFLKSQFIQLQDRFKYFQCFSPEIIRKIKYSKTISEKLFKKKIHCEFFYQKLKEGCFIYNTSKIQVSEMVTFLENISSGHMQIIFLANKEEEHTNGPELLLATHALKQEMEAIRKTSEANVQVNKKRGVALIHCKHWIFARGIKQSVRSAFNCIMSFSIPDMILTPQKKTILLKGLADVNYSQSIKARYADFRLSVAIHALNYNLEQLLGFLKSVQLIIEAGYVVSFHVSHLSSLRMRYKLQNIVIDVGRRQKMEVRCEQTKDCISSASLVFKKIDSSELVSEITHQTIMEIQSFKAGSLSSSSKQKLTQQKKTGICEDGLEFE